jgi:hypothetical protein
MESSPERIGSRHRRNSYTDKYRLSTLSAHDTGRHWQIETNMRMYHIFQDKDLQTCGVKVEHERKIWNQDESHKGETFINLFLVQNHGIIVVWLYNCALDVCF